MQIIYIFRFNKMTLSVQGRSECTEMCVRTEGNLKTSCSQVMMHTYNMLLALVTISSSFDTFSTYRADQCLFLSIKQSDVM